MRSVLYLGWRHLLYHRTRVAILSISLGLVIFLPLAISLLANRAEAHLNGRSESTPLLIGPRGSPLELTLTALYFRPSTAIEMKFGEVARIDSSGLGSPIPLHVRFRAGDDPIVGTVPHYFEFRGLNPATGKLPEILGECVLGHGVAKRRSLRVGNGIVSSPRSGLSVGIGLPLKMKIVGVLESTGTSDDDAIFTDLRTAWIVEGIGHGHEDPDDDKRVSQYVEVTPENIKKFHFHGKPADFPITAILVVANDEKSQTLLMGRYLGRDETSQAIEPKAVVSELLSTVFRVKTYALAILAMVIVVVLILFATIQVIALQNRKREREILTLLGGSKGRIRLLMLVELMACITLAALIAMGLLLLVSRVSSQLVVGFI